MEENLKSVSLELGVVAIRQHGLLCYLEPRDSVRLVLKSLYQ